MRFSSYFPSSFSFLNLEIVSPYAHPLCTITFQGVKFLNPSFEMFILF
jgi:hypothetical protein